MSARSRIFTKFAIVAGGLAIGLGCTVPAVSAQPVASAQPVGGARTPWPGESTQLAPPTDLHLRGSASGYAVSSLALVANGLGARVDLEALNTDGSAVAGSPWSVTVEDVGGPVDIPIPSTSLQEGRKYSLRERQCAITVPVCSPTATSEGVADGLHPISSPASGRNSPVDARAYLPQIAELWRARAQVLWSSATGKPVAATGTSPGVKAILAKQTPGLVSRAQALGASKPAHPMTFSLEEPNANALPQGGATVSVRIREQEHGSSGVATTSVRDYVFRFADVGARPVMTDYYLSHPTIDSQRDRVGGSTAQPAVVRGLANSPASLISTAPPVAASAAINRSAMVSWAHAHYNDAWQYNPDCTGWASRALHEGAACPMSLLGSIKTTTSGGARLSLGSRHRRIRTQARRTKPISWATTAETGCPIPTKPFLATSCTTNTQGSARSITPQ